MNNHHRHTPKALKQLSSEPQRGVLARFIHFIFNVLFMAVVIIIALSLVAACQPKTVTTANSMERQL